MRRKVGMIFSSWVTTMIAVSNSRAMRLRMRMTPSARSLSSGAVGSSARITGGRLTSARAIATRCCSPPDSCDGMARARWATSSASSSSIARRRASALGRPASIGSSATLSSTSRKGIR